MKLFIIIWWIDGDKNKRDTRVVSEKHLKNIVDELNENGHIVKSVMIAVKTRKTDAEKDVSKYL